MTECEWLTSSDPVLTLQSLTVVSDRCFRLFACACVRRVWHLLTDDSSRSAVLMAEQFADSGRSRAELAKACRQARRLAEKLERAGQWAPCFAAHAAHQAANCCGAR